jgi:hypothetical protein
MAYDFGNIDPLLDPVDNVVGNQTLTHESRSSCIPVSHDRTDRLLNDRID